MAVLQLALIAAAVALLTLLASAARAAEPCANRVGQVVALQGAVDLQPSGSRGWRPAELEQALCGGDLIRVGERSRAAIVLLDDGVIRIDENTTMRLARVNREVPSLIETALGRLYFFSRRTRSLDVSTPFVNAAVEGTEFLVEVGSDRAQVVVYEGRVVAANDRGRLSLQAGEAAQALAGQAPASILLAQPRNAVQWAVYYPPVLLADPGEAWPPAVRPAAAAARQGDAGAALAALEQVPARERGADFHALKASLLLSAGRTDAARHEIEAALGRDPGSARAQAVRAIVAVVEDRPDEAFAAGQRAAAAAPDSAAALVALSYAEQANLQLESARDTLLTAVRLQPDNAFAQARLAELWLELGYVARAQGAIDRALQLAPDLERVQTVRGFVALARFRPAQADEAFRKAVGLDSASPLARFGLGLASIRKGELARGRNDIEIATGLDPNRSLLRSYLGKAYFAERREPLAGGQYAIARELDPRDPTPWFYDAILKQSLNRPVEALADLERSIALNDNRAVYRSRLLLDKDRASRQAGVGRIYDDLGFGQLGINEASRSLSLDPGNAAAHRFLADVYGPESRTEVARSSQLLQAQLLQDVTINPVQPSLLEPRLALPGSGLGLVGLNEFSSVFERNQVQLSLSGLAGNNQTYGNETVLSALHDGISLSAGQFHYQTNGFRTNNDLRHDIYNVFGQAALSPTFNVQAEVRSRRTETGDLRLNFDPDAFSRTRQRDLDQDTARVGARYSPSPHTDVLASLIYSDRNDKISEGPSDRPGEGDFDLRESLNGWQGETQWIYRHAKFHTQVGFGSYTVDQTFGGEFGGKGDIDQYNAYAYGHLTIPDDVTWTLGLGYDAYSDDGDDLELLTPKLGVQWNVTDALRLRAAVARFLRPALVAEQTLQPTQIAGFNQFYDDLFGSKSWLYGIGLDARLTPRLYAGAQGTLREIDEIRFFDSRRVTEDVTETGALAYLYWAAHEEWALTGEVRYDVYEYDEGVVDKPEEVRTFSTPIGVRYFNPNGLFAAAGVTWVSQDVQRGAASAFPDGDDTFYLVDAGVGYRLPHRRGLVSLGVRNLLDHDFKYQDDAFRFGGDRDEPALNPLIPERTVLARIALNF